MELAKAFGLVLKKRRLKAGFSQEKLAERCEIERTFISMLERGLRRPSLGMTFELAKALNIDATNLVSEVEHLVQKKDE